LGGDGLRVAAVVAGIADADGVAFTPFHRGGDGLRSERHGDHVLDVPHHQPVAGKLRAVGIDVQVITGDGPFGVRAGGPRHLPDHGLDLSGNLVDLGQIFTEYLDSNRGADTGGKHVDACLIGMVQALDTPGNCSDLSISDTSLSTVMPGRH
jgi:hypothetical protein